MASFLIDTDDLFFVDETEDEDSELPNSSVTEQYALSELRFVEKDIYLNSHLIEAGTAFEVRE